MKLNVMSAFPRSGPDETYKKKRIGKCLDDEHHFSIDFKAELTVVCNKRRAGAGNVPYYKTYNRCMLVFWGVLVGWTVSEVHIWECSSLRTAVNHE